MQRVLLWHVIPGLMTRSWAAGHPMESSFPGHLNPSSLAGATLHPTAAEPQFFSSFKMKDNPHRPLWKTPPPGNETIQALHKVSPIQDMICLRRPLTPCGCGHCHAQALGAGLGRAALSSPTNKPAQPGSLTARLFQLPDSALVVINSRCQELWIHHRVVAKSFWSSFASRAPGTRCAQISCVITTAPGTWDVYFSMFNDHI